MPPNHERRQHERFAANGRAAAVVVDTETGQSEVLHGTVSDVSQSGAAMVMPKLLHTGTLGVVQLTLGSKRVVRGFEVRSARYDPSVGTQIGVRFWSEAPTEQLGAILAKLQAAVDAQAA